MDWILLYMDKILNSIPGNFGSFFYQDLLHFSFPFSNRPSWELIKDEHQLHLQY
jgi:hypothetical protein